MKKSIFLNHYVVRVTHNHAIAPRGQPGFSERYLVVHAVMGAKNITNIIDRMVKKIGADHVVGVWVWLEGDPNRCNYCGLWEEEGAIKCYHH